MAFERKAASLWHAFNALDDQNREKVKKTQLKVAKLNYIYYSPPWVQESGIQSTPDKRT